MHAVMEDWCLDGLHRKRDSQSFPAVMVLFGTLAPPCQIILRWGRAASLEMGLNSSLCPWELCKTENNTNFRFTGGMKPGEPCTKLGGDTNLSWELPASTALVPQIITVTPCSKMLCWPAGHEGFEPPLRGFVLSLRACNRFPCSRPAVFWGKKNRKSLSCLLTNQCKAQSSTELLIWLLWWTCLFSNAKSNE